MKKGLITFLFIVSLFGCAITPPPKITDISYENYRYEFGINIPKGWKAISKHELLRRNPTPDWINTEYLKVAFINQKTESTILVTCNKSIINPDVFEYTEDEKLRDWYSTQYENYKKKAERMAKRAKGKVENYSYEIKALKCYDGPCLMSIASISLSKESDKINIEMEVYYYRCDEDDLCIAAFCMTTKNEHFENSLEAFSELTKSLKKGVTPPEK